MDSSCKACNSLFSSSSSLAFNTSEDKSISFLIPSTGTNVCFLMEIVQSYIGMSGSVAVGRR